MLGNLRWLVLGSVLLTLLQVGMAGGQPIEESEFVPLTEEGLQALLERWLPSDDAQELIHNRPLLSELTLAPDRLRWTPPDRLRWEVSLSDDATLGVEDRGRAEEQLQQVLDVFVEREVKQSYDTAVPEQAAAYEALRGGAVAVIDGPPTPAPRPRTPATEPAARLIPGPPQIREITYRVGRLCRRYLTETVLEPTRVRVVSREPAEATGSRSATAGRAGGEPRNLPPGQGLPSPQTAQTASRRPVHMVSHRALLSKIRDQAAESHPAPRNPLNSRLTSELFGRAYHAFWSKDYSQAAEYLEQAAALDTGDPRVWYYRGFLALAYADTVAAEAHLAEAIRLHAMRNPVRDAEINQCLQRIQGSLRSELQTALAMARVSKPGASRQGAELIAGRP